jgi:3-oxoadipate enol-lactonase
MPVLNLAPQLNIHYLDHNPAGSRTAVLLHGLGATGDSWALQVPALTQRGFRLLAPDARGFGRSTYPGGGVKISDLAEDMAQLIRQTKNNRVSIVGISMGGTIALQLTLDHPELVNRLVLINTFASLRPDKPSIWLYFAMRFILLHIFGLPAQAKAVSQRLFPQPHQTVYREELERQIASADVRGYRAAMRALARFNVVKRLGEIQCPTLVITGAEDTTVPPANQHQLVTGIKGVHHIVLADAGHAATVQQAELVNQIMIDFLDEEPGAASSK